MNQWAFRLSLEQPRLDPWWRAHLERRRKFHVKHLWITQRVTPWSIMRSSSMVVRLSRTEIWK